MIQVADVVGSSQWYQTTVGLVSGHGGDEFEMLFAGGRCERLLLQLHRWEAHGMAFSARETSRWATARRCGSWSPIEPSSTPPGSERQHKPITCSPSLHGIRSLITTNSPCRDPDGYVLAIHTPFSNDP